MIRELNIGDKEEYMKITEEFYTSSAVMHPIPKSNREKTFEELIKSDKYTKCWLYEENNVIAAYALLAFTFSQEAGGEVVWLEELFVRDTFRNQGIGGKMLKFIHEKYSTVCKRFRLEIEPDNTSAKRLYEKNGFIDLPYCQMYSENQ